MVVGYALDGEREMADPIFSIHHRVRTHPRTKYDVRAYLVILALCAKNLE